MTSLENVLNELNVQKIEEVNAGTVWNWFGYTLTSSTGGGWNVTTASEGVSW